MNQNEKTRRRTNGKRIIHPIRSNRAPSRRHLDSDTMDPVHAGFALKRLSQHSTRRQRMFQTYFRAWATSATNQRMVAVSSDPVDAKARKSMFMRGAFKLGVIQMQHKAREITMNVRLASTGTVWIE
ncbi:hypothetical protein LTS18_010524 [Coniosporium uncinatum]|uniref:Uncharacterized protein n=1 Tax=Coniosporium uncinatum TaxID=93489 RepID=A0ACC3DKX1_9PEZI|nr:hypothetical protein LTS18_010524 [Coniosporium uncinatum]